MKKIIIFAEGPEFVGLDEEEEFDAEEVFNENYHMGRSGVYSPAEVFHFTFETWREQGYVIEDPTGLEARVNAML
jgi:hypothetical protein